MGCWADSQAKLTDNTIVSKATTAQLHAFIHHTPESEETIARIWWGKGRQVKSGVIEVLKS